MKKIAIFVDNLNIGGIQKSIINIINNIDLSKYKIDLYLFDDDVFYKNVIPKEVNLVFLKRSGTINKFINFDLAFKLSRNNNFNGIDYVYDMAIDFDSYQFDTAYNAIKCPSKRKIMWIHNDVINEKKYNKKYAILHHFMKSKYKYFDEFVGVSQGVIEPFKSLNKVNDKKFYVIPNLIDTKEIFLKCKENVSEIEIDKNKYNLVSVGRICFQKGYDIFLNYYKDIVARRKDVHFYLIGDGEEVDKINNLIKNYDLTDYVTLIGKKENPFKYESLMDGFVLTSRYEGQGMVILEAYALGLDIFITKNIEKYNGYNVKGVDDIVQSIIIAKKKKKKANNLDDYNEKILKKLNSLFND